MISDTQPKKSSHYVFQIGEDGNMTIWANSRAQAEEILAGELERLAEGGYEVPKVEFVREIPFPEMDWSTIPNDELIDKLMKPVLTAKNMNEIKIIKNNIYLGKWLIGHLCNSTITGRYMFAADVDYCSPLDAQNLRDLANRLDAMNEVSNEPA